MNRIPRVAYVVKRYPRHSETFIVNEILAHEAAGIDLEIFSLLACTDTHFQDIIARVRAPVSYLPGEGSKVATFWKFLQDAAAEFPSLWTLVSESGNESVREISQGITLARLARDRQINHLHAHFATASTTVTQLAARLAEITFSFTAHAKDIFHQSVNPAELCRKISNASSVVTVSDYNLRHLRSLCGPEGGCIRRIYNGLDLDRFHFRPTRDRSRLVLGVGRLVEKKGFSDLVAACSILKTQGCSFHCQIIGEGEEENALRSQIISLDLTDRVELTGSRPQAEIISNLNQAAVLAAPCVLGKDGNRDGLPTVLLEAMALGTPCVSTDVTGIPEVLRDNETGTAVPQGDPPALAAALRRLLDDPGLGQRFATRARALVEREFDVKQNSARLREVFASARSQAVPEPLKVERCG